MAMKSAQLSRKSHVPLYFNDVSPVLSESELRHSSLLCNLDHMCLLIDHDRFRFHVHEKSEANCGMRGDLFGWVLTQIAKLVTVEEVSC
ncbi:unnamed protein product [Eruca vesicaria subsp. sativa]|uniref:Uncharacterized protein n=1 Tax=Eruca vesicaria subsp. sativa TaxID=29727 RepID=A0ABC8M871_ERUVS|nr:unnamed protein product [Eruca vesicaria subsp. sativa]